MQPKPAATVASSPLFTPGALQQILDNSTAVVYVKDRDGRFLFANRRFLQVFRLQERQVIGRGDDDIFPPPIAAEHRRNDAQILARRAAEEFEETAPLVDGIHTYISVKFPLFDDAGEPYAVCGISTDITERKRTEEALRNVALGVAGARGADIFRELAKYLAIGLDVDIAFIAVPADDGVRRMRTMAMFAHGKIVDDVEYDLDVSPCRDVHAREFTFHPEAVSTRFPGDTMLRRHRIEGYAGIPLFDSSGRPMGVMAALSARPLPARHMAESMLKIFAVRAAAEIERMQAEAALRVSEEQYRSIFRASVDGLALCKADGRVVDANPAFCRMHGYTREQLLVAESFQFVHPDSHLRCWAFFDAITQGNNISTESISLRKDGTSFASEVHGVRVIHQGDPHLLVIVRDISERKEREEALRKSENRLRATVEAALDAVIGMDSDGRITEFNAAAEQCFGYRRSDLLGKPVAELIIPERFRAAYHQGLERYLKNREAPFLGRRIEVTGMRADASEFPAEIAIGIAQGREGDIFIGYLRDITERKQAEAARAQLERQLRQAQKMEAIGHLSGGIAHDFNNILTAVMGYIAMAQERQAQYADVKLDTYLERALRSGRQARDLIQQMLTFSRGQRGEARALNLPPLVKESVKLLRSTLPSSIEFETALDETVPGVMLDPVQIDQVLMNLCINARDAMEGSGVLRVSLTHGEHGDAICTSCRQPLRGEYVELAVADSGSGIAPEVMDRMFEPFFTTKEWGKGSGMGLSTVHGIVHEHGGHIVVDTAPGAGSIFRVLFPPMEVDRQQPFAPRADPAALTAPRLSGRVLVVDDEPAVAEFMGELLASWGLEVAVQPNGLSARAVFAEHPNRFDLVVTDQTMPKMTGTALARELLALRPDLPIVLYTGYAERLTPAEVRAQGIRALVTKPIDNGVLHALVRDLLQAPPRGVA